MGQDNSELLKKISDLERKCSLLESKLEEKKQVEDELILAQNSALSAKRSQSHFIANLSHEIRTPMNSIIGMSELLQETSLTEEQNMFLDIVVNNSHSLLTILNDLLDFSSIESGNMKICPRTAQLRIELERVIKVLVSRAEEKGIEFIVHFEDNVPEFVLLDMSRLGQVLLNLISNAIKFAANRGGVILYIGREEAENPNEVRLHFAVTDSGPGIAVSEIERIFESFTPGREGAKSYKEGTGLGLTISRNLVQLMGGMIWVRSKPKIGSAFHFSVTCEKAEQARLPESDHALQKLITGQSARTVRKRVLLAEDNPIHQKLTSTYLEQAGFEVTIVGDGKKALEKFETESFDLILMDLDMPVVNGIESVKAMKAQVGLRNASTPIIALSAGIQKDLKDELLFFNDFIQKPLNKNSLLSSLENLF